MSQIIRLIGCTVAVLLTVPLAAQSQDGSTIASNAFAESRRQLARTEQEWTAQEPCPDLRSRPHSVFVRPGRHSITTDCVVPSNVALVFDPGSTLAPAAGKTLTIEGQIMAAPRQQIFEIKDGRVHVGATREVSAMWFGAADDGNSPASRDNAVSIQAAADSGANGIYFPTGGGDRGFAFSSVHIPATIHAIRCDGSDTEPLLQRLAGTKMFVADLTAGLEVHDCHFSGAPDSRVTSNNTALSIFSTNASASAIGDNTKVHIHDNRFSGFWGFGVYAWFVDGFRAERNVCINTNGCLQIYDSINVAVRNNDVEGQASSTSFASMIALNSVGCGVVLSGVCQGNAGTTPRLHSRNGNISFNHFRGNSYAEDILIHDCTDCMVQGNIHQGSRIGVTVGPAANFNQVLRNVTVAGETMAGAPAGRVDPNIPETGINISGDNTVRQRWKPESRYFTPTHNRCVNTGEISCVIATTSASADQQSYLFQVSSSNCTSGGTEPVWPVTMGSTIEDGSCAWTNMGPFRAIHITVTGNTIEGFGAINQAVAVTEAIYISGATDGLTVNRNIAQGNYGSGIFSQLENRNLRISDNRFAAPQAAAFTRDTRCLWFADDELHVSSSGSGEVDQNQCDGYDYGIFARIVNGDMSKTVLRSNRFGSGSTHPIDISGDARRVPVRSADQSQ
jgi:hypothetical protein